MADRGPAALWEESLEGPGENDTDRLADEIVELAWRWAGGDAKRLRQAERILARTKYLERKDES